MKVSLKSLVKISAVSALAVAPALLSPGQASAEPIGTKANYIGGGVSGSVTNGGQTGDAAATGGNITARVAIPNAPVSFRGNVLFTNENSTVIPELSYDLPVAPNTNVYATAGVSLVQKDGKNAVLGNRDALVVGVGAETQVGKNFTVYGNTKLGVDAYKGSTADAVSFQVGAGYNF